MISAEYPETEADVDEDRIGHILSSEATHRIEAEYAVTVDGKIESFAELHRLIPMGEHEHPFVIVANDYDYEDTWQVFGTHRTAWAAFHAWVEVVRETHLKDCEKGREKCRHAPPWVPERDVIVHRKAKKAAT